jgi:signal peptidase I
MTDDTRGPAPDQAHASEAPTASPAIPASAAPAAKTERREGDGILRWLLETILLVALAFLLAQGIKTFIVQPYIIPTGSMIPTIEIGDRVLAEKITYRFREPEVGQIVVFDDPTGQHPQLIKRVIAVGGQTVDIKEGAVWVDGAKLDEPYVHGKVTDPGTVPVPVKVPEGSVWLMGDNRPNSGDSRFLGAQPLSAIRGRAVFTYWPPSRMGVLD